MSTHALIIGKDKAGLYHYGQTHFDGDENLEWLQVNMNDVDKVEDFLHYMAEGCTEGGEGHGISSLRYERHWAGFNLIYDKNKPKVDWYDDGYNCGISETKEEILEKVRQEFFDHPSYVSYWDGTKWENI